MQHKRLRSSCGARCYAQCVAMVDALDDLKTGQSMQGEGQPSSTPGGCATFNTAQLGA
jgi:hypothetical protein